MKLRKNFNIAGIVCFFISLFFIFIVYSANNNDTVKLFELLAFIFFAASIGLKTTAYIMKKMRRRRRKTRQHRHPRSRSFEDRAYMNLYAPSQEEVNAESHREEASKTEETNDEPKEEHIYQIFTIGPKRKRSRHTKRKKHSKTKSQQNKE